MGLDGPLGDLKIGRDLGNLAFYAVWGDEVYCNMTSLV